jgi:5-formyltetrahydrofolate cyclo-ligase
MAKPELRAAMRAARRQFTASLTTDERAALEAKLAELLWPLVSRADCFAIYAPRGNEIDPTPLARRRDSPTTAYPAFESATAPMIFRSGQCAEDCPLGGVQPPRQAKIVDPDLVLLPLLAVDPHGDRLGQGGGHYDRALPKLRAAGATLIGVGWAMQRLDFKLPSDPWDIPLDGFASPAGLQMWR